MDEHWPGCWKVHHGCAVKRVRLLEEELEQARAESYQRGVEEGVEDALGGKAAKHYQEALKAQGAAQERERCLDVTKKVRSEEHGHATFCWQAAAAKIAKGIREEE